MRRAEYEGGTGRLCVGDGWLLFVADSRHPSALELDHAARSEQPGRALAMVVAQSGFEVPPFAFVQLDTRMQGIVYGAVQLQIHDGEVATIDGAAADPWAHFDASASSTLVCGDSEFREGFWVELGVVSADSFRWLHDSGDRAASIHPAAPEAAFEEGQTESSSEADVDSPPAASTPGSVSAEEEVSLVDALISDFDATIDAIRFAEVRGDKEDGEQNPPSSRGNRVRPGAKESATASEAEADRDGGESTADSGADGEDLDATIDLEPGQVMLDDLHVERRMVEALVCLNCDNPNPPSSALCRHCGVLLSSSTTEIREVPQPVLGVVHLSGNREELLDADLIIGRNPGHLPLDRNQRAVVHAEDDRSVSRRHIELRLNQWKVMVINHQDTGRTVLENRGGKRTSLVPSVPQQLRAGDTVFYGDAWLRFEAEV